VLQGKKLLRTTSSSTSELVVQLNFLYEIEFYAGATWFWRGLSLNRLTASDHACAFPGRSMGSGLIDDANHVM